MCPLYYGREAITSGFNVTRTVGLLRNSAIFRPLVNAMHGQAVSGLWLLGNLSGIHKWQCDKFPVDIYASLIWAVTIKSCSSEISILELSLVWDYFTDPMCL